MTESQSLTFGFNNGRPTVGLEVNPNLYQSIEVLNNSASSSGLRRQSSMQRNVAYDMTTSSNVVSNEYTFRSKGKYTSALLVSAGANSASGNISFKFDDFSNSKCREHENFNDYIVLEPFGKFQRLQAICNECESQYTRERKKMGITNRDGCRLMTDVIRDNGEKILNIRQGKISITNQSDCQRSTSILYDEIVPLADELMDICDEVYNEIIVKFSGSYADNEELLKLKRFIDEIPLINGLEPNVYKIGDNYELKSKYVKLAIFLLDFEGVKTNNVNYSGISTKLKQHITRIVELRKCIVLQLTKWLRFVCGGFYNFIFQSEEVSIDEFFRKSVKIDFLSEEEIRKLELFYQAEISKRDLRIRLLEEENQRLLAELESLRGDLCHSSDQEAIIEELRRKLMEIEDDWFKRGQSIERLTEENKKYVVMNLEYSNQIKTLKADLENQRVNFENHLKISINDLRTQYESQISKFTLEINEWRSKFISLETKYQNESKQWISDRDGFNGRIQILIQQNTAEINNYKETINKLNLEINNYNVNFKNLGLEINEWRSKFISLETKYQNESKQWISDRDGFNGRIQILIQQNTAEINNYKETINKLNLEINNYNVNFKNLGLEINEWRSKFISLETKYQNESKQWISDRDGFNGRIQILIQQNTAEINNYKETINKLNLEINNYNVNFKNLGLEINEWRSKFISLDNKYQNESKQWFSDRDGFNSRIQILIQQNNNEINNYKETINNLNLEITNINVTIQNLRRDTLTLTQERDNYIKTIEGLKVEINKYQLNITNITNQYNLIIKERDDYNNRILILQGDLDKKSVEITNIVNIRNSYDIRIGQLESEIKRITEINQKIQFELNQKIIIIGDLDKKVKEFEAINLSFRSQTDIHITNINKYESMIVQINEDHRNKVAQLERLIFELRERERELLVIIKERETEISTIKITMTSCKEDWFRLSESYESLLIEIKNQISTNELLRNICFELIGKIEMHNNSIGGLDSQIKQQIEILTRSTLSKKFIDVERNYSGDVSQASLNIETLRQKIGQIESQKLYKSAIFNSFNFTFEKPVNTTTTVIKELNKSIGVTSGTVTNVNVDINRYINNNGFNPSLTKGFSSLISRNSFKQDGQTKLPINLNLNTTKTIDITNAGNMPGYMGQGTLSSVGKVTVSGNTDNSNVVNMPGYMGQGTLSSVGKVTVSGNADNTYTENMPGYMGQGTQSSVGGVTVSGNAGGQTVSLNQSGISSNQGNSSSTGKVTLLSTPFGSVTKTG